jgi:acyl carrier protein
MTPTGMLTHAQLDDPAALDPQIWPGVQNAFAEALGLDDDEVLPSSKIIEELDAESLDFLDIAFRLERAFSIKIPRGGIESAAREDIGEEAYEVDGVLTDAALERLKDALPEIPPDEFRSGLKTVEVPELFRVATFYNLVLHLMNQAEA